MQTAADIEIGQVIRRIRFVFSERKRRTVSQREFGAMIGAALGRTPYSQAAVAAWELGNDAPPGYVLASALKLLGDLVGRRVPYEELIPDNTQNLTVPYLPVAA